MLEVLALVGVRRAALVVALHKLVEFAGLPLASVRVMGEAPVLGADEHAARDAGKPRTLT